jgi:hypothetical protein
MAHKPGGLVHHQQAIVFVENLEDLWNLRTREPFYT